MIDLARLRRIHRHRIAPRLRRGPGRKGPIPLVVGVTGHGEIPNAALESLQRTFRTILRELSERCPRTELTVLSDLGAGAGLLAADVALLEGVAVIACLPPPIEDYAADFDAAGLVRFRATLARCSSVRIVSDATDRKAAYVAVGTFIDHFSHVLVAFPDGPDPRFPGLTADIVASRANGAPGGDLLAPPEVGPYYEIATPSASSAGSVPPEAVEVFPPRYPGDVRAKADALAELEALDTYNEDLSNRTVADEKAGAAERIRARTDVTADRLQSKTLRYLTGLYLASFVAAATQVATFDPWTSRVRGAALLLLFVAFGLAKLFDYENRYQDYRAISEGLRVQLAWWSAGMSDSVDRCYLRMQESELRWIRMVLRTIGLVDTRLTESSASGVSRGIELWVAGQAEYFERAARRERRLHRFYDLSASIISGASGLAGVLAGLTFLTTRTGPAVQHWLVVATGLGVLIVVLLHRYSENRGFQVNAERYARMSVLFARARLALARADVARGEATELARELGREALAEQAEWLLVRRTQPLAMVETPAITN